MHESGDSTARIPPSPPTREVDGHRPSMEGRADRLASGLAGMVTRNGSSRFSRNEYQTLL